MKAAVVVAAVVVDNMNGDINIPILLTVRALVRNGSQQVQHFFHLKSVLC